MSDDPYLHCGVAWYPEHWPEERWPVDLDLMAKAGLTVVRLAEFAWSAMEPAQGRFDLDWLERAVELAHSHGLVSVLGTPTAAPPAWLAQRRPAMMAVDETGRRVSFGTRCHYCVNDPAFHAAAQRIVSAMAERFGKNAHVIGWQIDNEYNRVCYCDACRKEFQKYLRRRYGSLDELNRHWSTAYWSQTYSAWEQIPFPASYHNPGLRLTFRRFVTESYRRFQHIQIEALRRRIPEDVWITHNFMNWFDAFDHYVISRDLDMASWDWYVGSGYHDHLAGGASHDLVRGYKRRNFWLMETQPGHVNWSPMNNDLRPGEARAMAWHAVAHGADAVLYWQWRSAYGGQEQCHGTLVDQAGQPRPFYEEVRQLGADISRAAEAVAGTSVMADAAVINDHDSRWSIDWQRHHKDFDYVAHLNHYYAPLARRNVQVDILGARTVASAAELAGYKLVIAPALIIVPETLARALVDYVKGGGVLVLTARCGMKDEHNALLPLRQPGLLAEAAGAEVEDYYALGEDIPVKGPGLEGRARLWAERLLPAGTNPAEVIAAYGRDAGWLAGKPAVTRSSYGNGRVYYVGAWLDDEVQDTLLGRITEEAGAAVFPAPAGVEVRCRRAPDGRAVWFVINHTNENATLDLPGAWHDLLTDRDIPRPGTLAPYGVMVCRRT